MLIISRGLERSADAALVVAEHEQYYSTVATPSTLKIQNFLWSPMTHGTVMKYSYLLRSQILAHILNMKYS